MGIHLREKKLGNGQVSYYLDIYHNKKRWYEFLDIHIRKNRPSQEDKEKKRLAQEIRAKRENELIVHENGLVDKLKRKADFIQWYEQYNKDRNLNYSHNVSSLLHVRRYLGGKPLPFHAITPDWIKEFTNYLLTKISNNTAGDYLRDICTALDEAERKEIIRKNPFSKIPRHERLQRKQIFRDAFTLDELQLLVDTPCKMEPQFRQAYLYSCFTGLRWSDVNQLRWSEIIRKTINGKEEWFLYFEQEKTEDIEYLPLSDQAVVILKDRERQLQETDTSSPYVFPLAVDDPDRKLARRVNYYLKRWAKLAGLDPKRMHFHTSRHTFATNVLENDPDSDLWTVSKLLGHKSIISTQIYAHVRDKRKNAAVKALPTLRINKNEAA
jgi:integrase